MFSIRCKSALARWISVASSRASTVEGAVEHLFCFTRSIRQKYAPGLWIGENRRELSDAVKWVQQPVLDPPGEVSLRVVGG